MLIVLLLLLVLVPAQAQKLVVCSVSVDGRAPFRLQSIYPDRKVYLEAAPLARQMNWSLVDRPDSSSILLEGKNVRDVVRLSGTTYVSAEAVATAFGYRFKESSGGLVVDFWTGTEAASATHVGMRVGKVQRLTSPNADYNQVVVAVLLKNPGSEVLVLNARNFSLVDHNKARVACNGSFDITLRPGQEQRVEGLYFDVPKRSTLRTLILSGPNGNVLATANL